MDGLYSYFCRTTLILLHLYSTLQGIFSTEYFILIVSQGVNVKGCDISCFLHIKYAYTETHGYTCIKVEKNSTE